MKQNTKIVKRNVKHLFTAAEVAQLNVDFGGAYDAVQAVKADFESVKASYKAKTTEAESRMTSLRMQINAGFDHRDKNCVKVLDIPNGKKHFFLCDEKGEYTLADAVPIITENLTEADLQQELIDAESVFENKEVIELFAPAGQDSGSLTVGRLNGKWFSALKVTIGKNTVTERLDGEQKATKERPDAVRLAVKRFDAWVQEQLGKEPAKGFTNSSALIVVAHAERAE